MNSKQTKVSLTAKALFFCITIGIINLVLILRFQISLLQVYSEPNLDTKFDEPKLMSETNIDTRSESFFELQTNNSPELPKLAVVHMGVHKTGSSSIQTMSKVIKDELLEDGYEMPWVNPPVELPHIGPNQVYFSECFAPSGDDSRNFKCTPELLIAGTQIAQRKNNILVSAESFSTIEGNGIESLKAYLSQWENTKVVVYYRHYFDYLRSKYNQGVKQRKIANEDAFESNLLLYVTRFANFRYPAYTAPLVERLREHFDDIEVVDYHDDSKDLVQKFFCDVLPDAPNSCKGVKKAESDEAMTSNESVDLAYGNLAWAAKKQGLIEIANDEQMDKLCNEIKTFITDSLGKTTKDLVQQCLPEDTMNDLLETSLTFQSEVFPDNDGTDLREFFENARSKFCIVDTKAVLEEGKWKQFFKDFKYD